jgi:hypothetical protein
MTGMTRRWVYDHAGDLSAVPLGTGSTPRLGFHPTSSARVPRPERRRSPTAADARAVLRQAAPQ